MGYFTYSQFMNELEELKKDYYIIGYKVISQLGIAKVTLFKRGFKRNKEQAEHE